MRKDRLCLQDIESAIDAIEAFVEDMNYEEFTDDDKTQSAVIRKFEVHGEATKNLPAEVRERYDEVPWNQMAGMRDRLIHGYFNIDTSLVWQTIQKELPPLKENIKNILTELPEE